jgi:hypothetical protein
VPLGSSEAPGRCSQWSGRCVECLTKRSWLEGIFCANFYWSVGGYPPCQQIWCGKCYTTKNELGFHISKLTEEEEFENAHPRDRPRMQKSWGRKARSEDDYLRERDGDCTLVPFKCDLCIFRKLAKVKLPQPGNPQHSLLMSCIRRLNLDAFWSRSTATVQGQRDKLKQGLALSSLVGVERRCTEEGLTGSQTVEGGFFITPREKADRMIGYSGSSSRRASIRTRHNRQAPRES